MKAEELAKILEAAPKIGQVEAKDFIGFVSLIERRDPKTGAVKENPYMAVDGRLAMARLDHIKQEGKLDIGPMQIVNENERAITVMVPVVSSLYGTVYGTATSRLDQVTRANKPTIESASPWEVAETSAIGRALGMLGYGLLPGAGLASAEDMERATGGEKGSSETGSPGAAIIPWGKHKGKTIAEIAKEDPTYLDYVLDNSSDLEVRQAVREYLGEIKERATTKAEVATMDRAFSKEFLEGKEGDRVEEVEQSEEPQPDGQPEDEPLGGKPLAGSTAFWAKARSLKIGTAEGKRHQEKFRGEDGKIDWAKATEALGKEDAK